VEELPYPTGDETVADADSVNDVSELRVQVVGKKEKLTTLEDDTAADSVTTVPELEAQADCTSDEEDDAIAP
jgi:hypothetical protein